MFYATEFIIHWITGPEAFSNELYVGTRLKCSKQGSPEAPAIGKNLDLSAMATRLGLR